MTDVLKYLEESLGADNDGIKRQCATCMEPLKRPVLQDQVAPLVERLMDKVSNGKSKKDRKGAVSRTSLVPRTVINHIRSSPLRVLCFFL